MDYKQFGKLLNRSKSYQLEGAILTITDYHTGMSIKLDLSKMTEEMFNEVAEQDDRYDHILKVVSEIQMEREGIVDQMSEDITESIIEECGYDVTDDEIREVVEDYYTEE